MKLTVFYSWQSDRNSALCRNFIHIALRDAADRLASRRGVEVVVDSDTEGVPGTPPITTVILEKIAACDVFVADMTFVGKTDETNDDGETKLMPNPNVMGEFGYGLSQKGWRRILLVMNEAYGPPKALPFDLGQFRHPATYNVATEKPDGPRRAARNALSARLEANLEVILDDILGSAPPEPDFRQPLQDLWLQTQNGRFASNPPCLVSQPSAYVYVVPAAALDPPRLVLNAIRAHRHLLLPASGAEAVAGQDSNQWWAHAPTSRIDGLSNPEAAWCGRLLRPGIVEHILNLGRPDEEDQDILANGFALEKQIVSIADRALALLDALGLAGPTLIAVNFYELDNVRLSGRHEIGRFRQPSLRIPPVMIAAGYLKSGNSLRETFDRLWLAAGFSDGSLSFASSEEWAGYAPNSAY